MAHTLEAIASFLQSKLGNDIDDLSEIGTGSWSQCFGFTHQSHQFAAKFGIHGEDFEHDRLAHRFNAPHLPVPEILEFGGAFDGFYSIAPLVPGTPLESLASAEWIAAIPSIVDTLEALRVAADAVGEGWGAGETTVGESAPPGVSFCWRSTTTTRTAESPVGAIGCAASRLYTQSSAGGWPNLIGSPPTTCRVDWSTTT